MKKIKVTILGCGSSIGVPSLGNNWGNCNPNNPKNRRRRCSILLEINDFVILLDEYGLNLSPPTRLKVSNEVQVKVNLVGYTQE